MSIRSIIAAALRGIAKMVVVATEVVVAGVRSVVYSLVPSRNTDLADVAQGYIGEDTASAGMAVAEPIRSPGAPVRIPEAERVRRAAVDLREGRRIAPSLLDPDKAADLQILSWLADRDALQLGMIARASDRDIVAHLDGDKTLRMPLMAAAEAKIEERREALRPPNTQQWMKILVAEAAANGDDDPDFEMLLERAQSLADAHVTLADYQSQELEEAPVETVVIDDREDAG